MERQYTYRLKLKLEGFVPTPRGLENADYINVCGDRRQVIEKKKMIYQTMNYHLGTYVMRLIGGVFFSVS